MDKYYVTIHETDAVTYVVEAEGEAEAIRLVKDDPTLASEVNRDFVGFAGEGEAERVSQ